MSERTDNMLFEPIKRKKGFLELMADGPVMAPCVYDCVSARMVERAGFKAMCLSGGELAVSHGYPDLGLITQDEVVRVVERISACTEIPMLVDIDTGFGNELNLIRTCRRMASAGAKAVHLEDQTFPKRCGHLKGKNVIGHDEYISKIKAASYALEGTDCILIARTDAYHILGKQEAIQRCNDAIDAGAQISFVEGTGSLEDIKEISERVKGHKMFAMFASGASPRVTMDQLVQLGYELVTMHYTMAGALMGMLEFGKKCFDSMSDLPVADDPRIDSSANYMFELMGLSGWLKTGNQFNSGINADSTDWEVKSYK